MQAHILSVLSATPTPVLLGHSLESDLNALKICHPRCIDTAVIFHHPRGRPLKPGLAWLTKKWCGREIQNRGEGGHDPEEDARACLDLLRKKVENGEFLLHQVAACAGADWYDKVPGSASSRSTWSRYSSACRGRAAAP